MRKKVVTFTIDKDVAICFDEYAKLHSFNKSLFISNLLKEKITT